MSTGRSRAALRIALVLGLVACLAVAVVARAVAQHHAAPRLHATPARVAQGATVVLHGRGFPTNAHIVLRATSPAGKAKRIGEAQTGLRGGFVAPIAIDRDTAPGVYLAAACHDRCHVKATTTFRVLRP